MDCHRIHAFSHGQNKFSLFDDNFSHLEGPNRQFGTNEKLTWGCKAGQISHLGYCLRLNFVSEHIQILLAAFAVVVRICDAGQLCSSCSDLAEPGDCHRYITCDDMEQCYQRQYTNSSGTPLYELGCISSRACQYTPAMIGKRVAAGSHFKCFACCNQTALCNHVLDCGKETLPILNACASCNNVSHPSDCRRQESCAKDERCYVYKYRTNSGSDFYDLGCMSESVCPPTVDAVSHIKRSEDHHFKCLSCCKNASLCNKHLTCDANAMPTIKSTLTSSLPRDCSELQLSNGRNGPYTIFPYGFSNLSISVYCEFDSDGTWTVIQRRFNGSVDFYRNWTDYKRGFGSIDGEYWLGNDVIHQLTSLGNYSLKILLTDWNNTRSHADYSIFYVANETYNYTLTIGGYSGNAKDAVTYHNGNQFSTWDRDNDKYVGDCVSMCGKGAWWHKDCCHSSLNGIHSQNYVTDKYGIYWNSIGMGALKAAMKTTEMMVKQN